MTGNVLQVDEVVTSRLPVAQCLIDLRFDHGYVSVVGVTVTSSIVLLVPTNQVSNCLTWQSPVAAANCRGFGISLTPFDLHT